MLVVIFWLILSVIVSAWVINSDVGIYSVREVVTGTRVLYEACCLNELLHCYAQAS
jgi:hypothetical protein